jgi:hypothetical protein
MKKTLLLSVFITCSLLSFSAYSKKMIVCEQDTNKLSNMFATNWALSDHWSSRVEYHNSSEQVFAGEIFTINKSMLPSDKNPHLEFDNLMLYQPFPQEWAIFCNYKIKNPEITSNYDHTVWLTLLGELPINCKKINSFTVECEK